MPDDCVRTSPEVRIDEKSLQLIGHSRKPLAMSAGAPAKHDYEYVRKGTTNLFVAVEPKAGQRSVQVTERRVKVDLVSFVQDSWRGPCRSTCWGAQRQPPQRDAGAVSIGAAEHHWRHVIFEIAAAIRIIRATELTFPPKSRTLRITPLAGQALHDADAMRHRCSFGCESLIQ